MNRLKVILSCFSLFFLLPAQSADHVETSRLSPKQTVQIMRGGKNLSVLLTANDTSKPLLNTKIKQSIRVVNNDIEKAEFFAVAGSTAGIRQFFRNYDFKLRGRFFDDFIVVKNFTHGMEDFTESDLSVKKINDSQRANYWYMVVPKQVKVQEIFVQRDWFSSGLGTHGQLRFKLNSPLLLIPQNVSESAKASQKIEDLTKNRWQDQFLAKPFSSIAIPGDLVYSLFALRYQGGPDDWSFMTGIGGAFANAYTLSSVSHNLVYLGTGDYVEQNALIEPETLGTRTFFSVLERSNNFAEKNIYHLIFNSCITEMNAALSAKGKGYPLQKLGVQSTSFNPYRFKELLKPLFKNQNGEDMSMNEEFNFGPKEKSIHPQVAQFKLLAESKELDEKITSVALQLSPLTYKELLILEQTVKRVEGELKTSQSPDVTSGDLPLNQEQLGQILSKMQIDLPFQIGRLTSKQTEGILLQLVNDPRIIQGIELFRQRL